MALHRHASQLSTATSVDEIVRYTLDAMQFALGFDLADMLIVEDKKLRIMGSRGMAISFSELPMDGPGITVKAANAKKTLRIPDIRLDEAYMDHMGRVGSEARGLLSELAVPVITEYEVAAVLNVDSHRLNAFTEEDQTLLETLAIHVGSELRRLKREEMFITQARIFENMSEGVNVSDDKGIMSFANPAFERMFGYKSGELIGKHLSVLNAYPPEENTLIVNDIIHTLKMKGAWRGELRNRKKDGTVFITSAHVSTLEVAGKTCWISVQEDITEGKRIEQALHQRARELAALQETVLDLTRTRDLPELLNGIVQRAARLLGASSGGMYICNAETQEVRCVAGYNTATNPVGTVLKYGEGAAGVVAATGKPLMIDDYRTWPGRAMVFEKDQPFIAVLSAPMIWRGQVTGVIHVLSSKEPRHFTHEDLDLLTMFANHAAVAIENARLLEQGLRQTTESQKPFELA